MVLSYQTLKKIIEGKQAMIHPECSMEGRVQPASLDVPTSDRCYRVSVSALPRDGVPMSELLKRFTKYQFEIKNEGVLLERNMTYVLPLAISLSLSDQFRSVFSPKSTVGRNDGFARVLTETGKEFDSTDYGYNGRLYLEMTPLSFDSTIYPFEPLTQMRVVTSKNDHLSSEELAVLHAEYGIVRDRDGRPTRPTIENGALYLHLDLEGSTVGYESLKNLEASVHIGSKEVDEKSQFFRKIQATPHGDLILHPGFFYLLATCERIVTPPNVCATMQEYSVNMGEFRSHYAGFFDNGFGGETGTHGVLEFRPRDLPLCFYHSQRICRMVFYKTDEIPEQLYKTGANNYTGYGPKLAKNFIGFSEW